MTKATRKCKGSDEKINKKMSKRTTPGPSTIKVNVITYPVNESTRQRSEHKKVHTLRIVHVIFPVIKANTTFSEISALVNNS